MKPDLIETYPEMDTKIIEILRWDSGNSVMLYAAQRIEELMIEVKRLRGELHDEQIQSNELRAEVERLQDEAEKWLRLKPTMRRI